MATLGIELGGNLFLVFGPKGVWPPSQEIVLSRSIENSLLQLKIDITGALDMSFSFDDEKHMHVRSAPIKLECKNNPLVLTISWSYPDKLDLMINESYIATLTSGKQVVDFIPISERSQAVREFPDMSESNSDALINRRAELSKIINDQNDRSNLHGYLKKSLAAEVNQIEELLYLIEAGKTYHVIGLSARLRVVVCRGGRNQRPLLQNCAAFLDEPVFIYSAFEPEFDPSLPNPIWLDIFAISDRITEATPINMDIDVWLNRKAASLNGKWLSNNSYLRSFADTVGAHLDTTINPVVSNLRSISSGRESEISDRVTETMLMTAYALLPHMKRLSAN